MFLYLFSLCCCCLFSAIHQPKIKIMSSQSRVIKCVFRSDIRRITLADQTFKTLNQSISSCYGFKPSDTFKLRYIDDEGDQVIINSDQELEEAFACAAASQGPNKVLRLFVELVNEPSSVPSAIAIPSKIEPVPEDKDKALKTLPPAAADDKAKDKKEKEKQEEPRSLLPPPAAAVTELKGQANSDHNESEDGVLVSSTESIPATTTEPSITAASSSVPSKAPPVDASSSVSAVEKKEELKQDSDHAAVPPAPSSDPNDAVMTSVKETASGAAVSSAAPSGPSNAQPAAAIELGSVLPAPAPASTAPPVSDVQPSQEKKEPVKEVNEEKQASEETKPTPAATPSAPPVPPAPSAPPLSAAGAASSSSSVQPDLCELAHSFFAGTVSLCAFSRFKLILPLYLFSFFFICLSCR